MGAASAMVAAAWPLLLLFLLVDGTSGVQITALRVPSVVRNGSDSAVLDCEYNLTSRELHPSSGLVVKWYFNNGPSPVYQWIAGGRPQDLGVLRGRLNLLYRASENNAVKHSALHIVNPTIELSGEYKCHVSTFDDEDFMTKKMVVFAPGQSLEVWSSPLGEGLNVTCRGRGVFPEPKLALYVDQTELPGVVIVSTRRGEAYDVSASALLPPRAPSPDGGGVPAPAAAAATAPYAEDETGGATVDPGPALVGCQLKIPDTDYAVQKSFIYYKGEENPTNDSGAGPPRRAPPPPLLLGALAVDLLVLLSSAALAPPAPTPSTATPHQRLHSAPWKIVGEPCLRLLRDQRLVPVRRLQRESNKEI